MVDLPGDKCYWCGKSIDKVEAIGLIIKKEVIMKQPGEDLEERVVPPKPNSPKMKSTTDQ